MMIENTTDVQPPDAHRTSRSSSSGQVVQRGSAGAALSCPLTDRERTVLLAASRDMTAQQTADYLTSSVGTIRTHRSSVLLKLRVHSMAGAVGRTFREGWFH